MAVDFNGLSSNVNATAARVAVSSLNTLCLWANADSAGEDSLAFLVSIRSLADANHIIIQRVTAANTMRVVANWSTTDGTWQFSAADGQWNAIAVSYDGTATTNNPIVRVNFVSAAVTTLATPAGTFSVSGDRYIIGNNVGGTRTWDGMISHVQVFKETLTNREMDQALIRPGSVRSGLRLWTPLYNSNYLTDLSDNNFTGLGTALTDRDGGPPASPLLARNSWVPYIIVESSINLSPASSEYGHEIGSISLPALQSLNIQSPQFGNEISSVFVRFFGPSGGADSASRKERTYRQVFEDRRVRINQDKRLAA